MPHRAWIKRRRQSVINLHLKCIDFRNLARETKSASCILIFGSAKAAVEASR